MHRDLPEAAARASRLRDLGFDGAPYPALGAKAFRGIRQDPPQVILLDLTRLPSYGKAMGVLLRQNKALGAIPLVFVEGDPEKTAQVREILPDAIFTTWTNVAAAIEKAVRLQSRQPAQPRLPATPLVAKLGIDETSRVAILHAPEGFRLPGVSPRKQPDEADVVMLFFRTSAALSRELPALAGLIQGTQRKGRRVWVLWPKKASAAAGDLSLPLIRSMASAYNLVDYKICAVDDTWSATTLGQRR